MLLGLFERLLALIGWVVYLYRLRPLDLLQLGTGLGNRLIRLSDLVGCSLLSFRLSRVLSRIIDQ